MLKTIQYPVILEANTLQRASQFCTAMDSRGEIVKQVVSKSGVTITRLAEKLNISRTQLYADFSNPEMSFDRILAIGKILRHDFSKDFKALPPALVEMVNGVEAPTASQLQECQSKLVSVQERLIDAMTENARYRALYGPIPAS
jgi:plasmid maintenance system antidote protein VapI